MECSVELRGKSSPLPESIDHFLQVEALEKEWNKIFATVDANVTANGLAPTLKYAIYDQVVRNDKGNR